MSVKVFALIVAASVLPAGIVLAQPTLSDIATCNEEAHTKIGGPSALPRPGPGPRGGSATTGEKTDPSGSVITGTQDPLVEGMAADRADDPVYRTAYRECMQRQMQRGRR